MKSVKSNADFNQNDNEGIDEFKISYDDENDSISIGNNNLHKMHKNTDDNNHYIHEIKKDEDGHIIKDGKHEYVIHKEDGDHTVIDIKSDSDEHSNVWVTKDGMHIKGESHVIIESDNGDGDSIFYYDSDSDEDSIFIHKKDDNGFFFVDTDGKDPLVFIDGKKSSKEAMEKLDSKAIDNIEILKGDKALEKYGKGAKDGVLLISTKNN